MKTIFCFTLAVTLLAAVSGSGGKLVTISNVIPTKLDVHQAQIVQWQLGGQFFMYGVGFVSVPLLRNADERADACGPI